LRQFRHGVLSGERSGLLGAYPGRRFVIHRSIVLAWTSTGETSARSDLQTTASR
jgi:hypothetical protein